jgi:hypothetical protein
MNSNELEYQIVVDMAETLVPDVCGVIMTALENIHIKVGRLEWEKNIKKVNAEYLNKLSYDPDDGYLLSDDMTRVVPTTHFKFNWRGIREYSNPAEDWIWNHHCHMMARLPANYQLRPWSK